MACHWPRHTMSRRATLCLLGHSRRCPCAPATRRSCLSPIATARIEAPGGNATLSAEEESRTAAAFGSKTASSNRARVNAAKCGAAQRSASRPAKRLIVASALHDTKRHAGRSLLRVGLHARRRARPRFASSCVRAARRHAHAALAQLRDQRAVRARAADAGARVSLEPANAARPPRSRATTTRRPT